MRDGGRRIGLRYRSRLVRRGRRGAKFDAGIERHHGFQQAGTTWLTIDGVRIVNAIADIFARTVLVGTGPDIRRWLATCGITKPVVLLELGQRATDIPVLVTRRMRRAV